MQDNREVPMTTSAMHKPPALQERGEDTTNRVPAGESLTPETRHLSERACRET